MSNTIQPIQQIETCSECKGAGFTSCPACGDAGECRDCMETANWCWCWECGGEGETETLEFHEAQQIRARLDRLFEEGARARMPLAPETESFMAFIGA